MINVPTKGRQKKETSSTVLIGIDGNAWSVMGKVRSELQKAGASKEFREEYSTQAMSGDYDHLLAVSVAFLSAEPIDEEE